MFRRPERSNRFIGLGFLCLVLLGAPLAVQAGTQDGAGIILKKDKPDKKGNMTLTVLLKFVEYMSRGSDALVATDKDTWRVIAHQHSATMINGKLVDYRAFQRAIEKDNYGYFYESNFMDVAITPDYELGQLVASDTENNTVTLRIARAKNNSNYLGNAEYRKTFSYSDKAEFYMEDVASSEAETLGRFGDWLQIHPPHRQILWVETDDGAFDHTILIKPDDAGRGDTNSNTGPFVSLGYDADGKLMVKWRKQGKWVKQAVKNTGSVLDGKRVPVDIAYRPGRMGSACAYRSHETPHTMFFTTRGNEVRGEITRVNDDSFQVKKTDVDGKTSTVSMPLRKDARVYLDGADADHAKAIQVGRQVRVFPERKQQRLVLLQRYIPARSGKSTYQPVAFFTPSKRYNLDEYRITFNGSSSYDHDGEITRYAWDFGDGTTATGPVVTHTYKKDDQYKVYRVKLAVTTKDGETDSEVQYVTVMSTPQSDVEIDKTGLVNGVVHLSWPNLNENSGWQSDPWPEPERIEFLEESYQMSGRRSFRHFQGLVAYFEAPKDGWYDFRCTGNYKKGAKLYVHDHLVVDTHSREQWGTMSGNAVLGGRIYLKAGMHPIRYIGVNKGSYMAIGWSGPGVTYVDGMRIMRNKDLLYRPQDYKMPVARGTADVLIGDAPLKVNFSSDGSLGPIAQHEWDLGDGTQVKEANPSHTYKKPGLYKAILNVTDADGNKRTDSVNIQVRNPKASKTHVGLSINFDKHNNDKVMSSGDIAGVIELDQWLTRRLPPTMNEMKEILRDSLGRPLDTYFEGQSSRMYTVPHKDNSPNHLMMNKHHILRQSADDYITFKQIPLAWQKAGYDVYLYTNVIEWNKSEREYRLGKTETYRYTVNDKALWIAVDKDNATWDGKFRESKAETEAKAIAGASANYIVIRDLNDPTLKITANLAPIAGIQIITKLVKHPQEVHLDAIADRQVVDPAFLIHADSSTGQTPEYQIVSGPATVAGNRVTLTGESGVVMVRASVPGGRYFSPAEKSATFLVNDPQKQQQSIHLASIGIQSLDQKKITVKATASSGLPVNLTVTSGPATVTGDILTLTGEPGTVTIRANQPGNDTWNPAPTQYETFMVHQRDPVR